MVHIDNVILAISRNTFDSVLMRWINLEPIVQNEVSQKKTCCKLAHVYEIERDGTDDPICRKAAKTQEERTDLWTLWVKERVGRIEGVALKHMRYRMYS